MQTHTPSETGTEPVRIQSWASRRRKVALVAGSLALAIPAGTLLATSSAGASTGDDSEIDAEELFASDSIELTAEELAELNAENDALAAHLDSKGIAYTRTLDDVGINNVDWDYEDDAANAAADEFYAARYPLTPEELAESNAENDALADHLRATGIAFTNDTDAWGVRFVDWDYEDEAAADAVDEFYAARYPLTPEELGEANADAEALADFLTSKGASFTRDTDACGVTVVEWDYEDEAINQLVDAFYTD